MTRYEKGFLTKCAEYGLDAGAAMGLMKIAVSGVVSGPLGGVGQVAGGVLANAKPVNGPLGVGMVGRALGRSAANGSARDFLARTPIIRNGLAGRMARLPYGRYAPTQPTSVVYGH